MRRERSVLQTAVREVVAALLAGDWVRHSDEVSGAFYYVIREKDQERVQKSDDWAVVLAPKPPDRRFYEWYVKAVLAEPTRDHFESLRKEWKSAGGAADTIEELISAAVSKDSDESRTKVETFVATEFNNGRYDLLLSMIDAMWVQSFKSGDYTLSDEDRQHVRAAFELRLLKELGERFGKAVERATTFDDWLMFYSPHLREAVRCYLYGFFSAAVLSAVAALDVRMRAVAKIDPSDYEAIPYKQLVAQVFGTAGVLGNDAVIAGALNGLFLQRNKIAHQGAEADSDIALDAITLVRSALDRMPIGGR